MQVSWMEIFNHSGGENLYVYNNKFLLKLLDSDCLPFLFEHNKVGFKAPPSMVFSEAVMVNL